MISLKWGFFAVVIPQNHYLANLDRKTLRAHLGVSKTESLGDNIAATTATFLVVLVQMDN